MSDNQNRHYLWLWTFNLSVFNDLHKNTWMETQLLSLSLSLSHTHTHKEYPSLSSAHSNYKIPHASIWNMWTRQHLKCPLSPSTSTLRLISSLSFLQQRTEDRSEGELRKFIRRPLSMCACILGTLEKLARGVPANWFFPFLPSITNYHESKSKKKKETQIHTERESEEDHTHTHTHTHTHLNYKLEESSPLQLDWKKRLRAD